jgi:hypothetical protein
MNETELNKYLPRLQSLWPWEETALVFLNHDATEEFVLGWGTSRGWFAGMTGLDEGGMPAFEIYSPEEASKLAASLAASLFGGKPNRTNFTLRIVRPGVTIDDKPALLKPRK